MQAWRNDVLHGRLAAPRLVSVLVCSVLLETSGGTLATALPPGASTSGGSLTVTTRVWPEGCCCCHLHEVMVNWNENFPLIRTYKWRNKKIATDDIEHGFFMRERGGLRGFGPLQICGAALSAAVEADEWAARFFDRGGVPSVVLKTAANLSAEDSDRLVTQWLERESKRGPGSIWWTGTRSRSRSTLSRHSCWNRASTQQQSWQRMFGMDADLLNAAVSGSSLTYQNVGQRLDNFDPYHARSKLPGTDRAWHQ